MSGNVQFEGMIRVSGSISKVEKTLATLKKAGVEVLDDIHHHHHLPWPRPRPFPWPGIPVPLELGAFLRDAKFVRSRITAFNKTAPVKARVKFNLLPDWGIYGGRKYHHLHLGNRILPLNEEAFGGIIIEGMKELRGLGAGNEIR